MTKPEMAIVDHTQIKIVRNDKPNEEGRWLEVPYVDRTNVRSWRSTVLAFERFVPAGYHIVAVRRVIEPRTSQEKS